MQSRNKKTIYVSNLPKSATEEDLETIFLNFGEIISCELDNNTDSSYIEFANEISADRALDMDNVDMGSNRVRVAIAFQDQYTENPVTYTLSSKKIDYSSGIQIFVGDISYNVDEKMLTDKFSEFGTIIEAKVVRMPDGKHRGFAFISYQQETEAEKAIQAMHNTLFHNRKIKCNWASKKKNSPETTSSIITNNVTRKSNPIRVAQPQKTFEEICFETTDTNTSVYVTGENLFEDIIRPCFERFGYIRNIKAFPEKNHAFVNYESHDAAAYAILQLNGYTIGSTSLKCAWGKKGGAVTETDKRMNNSPQSLNELMMLQGQQKFPESGHNQHQLVDSNSAHGQQQLIDNYQTQHQQQQQNYANYQYQQYMELYNNQQQYYANAQGGFYQQQQQQQHNLPMQQQQQQGHLYQQDSQHVHNNAQAIDYYNNLQMHNFYMQQQHQQQQQLQQQQQQHQQQNYSNNPHLPNGGNLQSQRFFK